MAESVETGRQPEWLVLVHQLPPGASNPRVKIWRRLQELGAVALRSAVYVLPNTPSAREDFAWVREQIAELKGQATILTADATDPRDRQALVDAFRTAREGDFALLAKDVDRFNRWLGKTSSPGAGGHRRIDREANAFRERLRRLDAIDFFAATGGERARSAIARMETQMPQKAMRIATTPATAAAIGEYRGRVWVTRPRPGVDRMASAWLIRRFVDSKARFVFADRPSGKQIPFDMYTGEFSHHGSLCTFEAIVARFGLVDPAVTRIGHIVHDIDLKETRYDPPEAAAIGRMVEGLRKSYADDDELLEHGVVMFEALARSLESEGKSRVPPRTRKGSRKD